MNNTRRATLSLCSTHLSNLKLFVTGVKDSIKKLENLKEEIDLWSSYVDSVTKNIESVEKGEKAALESIPDNLQFGLLASNLEESLSLVEDALSEVNSLKDSIDQIEDTYITSFLSTFDPEALLDKLDEFIEAIVEAKDKVEEARA